MIEMYYFIWTRLAWDQVVFVVPLSVLSCLLAERECRLNSGTEER